MGTKLKLKITKVILLKTLINNIPTFFGMFFWVIIVFGGIGFLKTEFYQDTFYPVLVMLWVVVSLNLTKIIPSSHITWENEDITCLEK